MENQAKEEAQSAARKQKHPATKKNRRKSAAARSHDGSPPNQLITRGRNLVNKAEKWAGGAARLASPLADASANAVVMGILGLGVGVAIGAMLPRMNVGDMIPGTRRAPRKRGR